MEQRLAKYLSALRAAEERSLAQIAALESENRQDEADLEKIRRNKRVFFNGIPYPIYETSGSFVVIGLDKHKDKQRILEALRSFR